MYGTEYASIHTRYTQTVAVCSSRTLYTSEEAWSRRASQRGVCIPYSLLHIVRLITSRTVELCFTVDSLSADRFKVRISFVGYVPAH